MPDAEFWLRKLAKLRVDAASGDPAPHKPLLVLVVLETAERGELGEELLLSPDLAFRFSVFWGVVAKRRNAPPNIRLPFHHLGSDGFWEPLMADGSPSPDKKLTTKVRLDPGFLACAGDAGFRETARRTLIARERYFRPGERAALYSLVGMEVPDAEIIREDAAQYSTDTARGREGRFRIDVVITAYQHTCALTGYRLTTVDMESIVDAAHIHQFSDSRNNHPSNGLSLCKNAHWQFDRGLWSLTDDYKILLRRDLFIEVGGGALSLGAMEGQAIKLPAKCEYWPASQHMAWHRRRHGFSDSI